MFDEVEQNPPEVQRCRERANNNAILKSIALWDTFYEYMGLKQKRRYLDFRNAFINGTVGIPPIFYYFPKEATE